MAKREIEEAEYQRLKAREQVADFVEPIYNNPKLSKQAKRLIKEQYPDMEIPDLDIEDRLEQRLDAEKKERLDAEQKRDDEAREKHFKELRAKTQKDYGFTDEGMADLEKFMLEKNIGDYEVAASYRASKEPKPSEANADDGRDHFWNHAQQDGFAEISKDPEAWGRKEILTAIRRDQAKARDQGF